MRRKIAPPNYLPVKLPSPNYLPVKHHGLDLHYFTKKKVGRIYRLQFHFSNTSNNWLGCITASDRPGVQTPDTERVSAQSGQRKGGPRHYDLRAEVWRGCTPKVSEFEGSSEPSPVRFVGGGAHPRADLEGGSVPIFSISVTWYRGPGFDS